MGEEGVRYEACDYVPHQAPSPLADAQDRDTCAGDLRSVWNPSFSDWFCYSGFRYCCWAVGRGYSSCEGAARYARGSWAGYY